MKREEKALKNTTGTFTSIGQNRPQSPLRFSNWAVSGIRGWELPDASPLLTEAVSWHPYGRVRLRSTADLTLTQPSADISFQPQQRWSKDFLSSRTATKLKRSDAGSINILTALINNYLFIGYFCFRENIRNSQEKKQQCQKCWPWATASSAVSVPSGSSGLPSKS